MSDTTRGPGDEVTGPPAEHDEPRGEADRAAAREHRHHRARRAVAAALVVLACLSFLVAMPGVWANRTLLHSDRFVARAGPLIADPAVQEALSVRITDELMILVDTGARFEEALPERGRVLAVPLANAVETFVRDRVEQLLASERVEPLWTGAIRVAHEAAVRVLRDESDVVTARPGQVTLDLIPVIHAVLVDIAAQAPEVFGRDVRLPEVVVEDGPGAAIARIEQTLGVELDDDFGQVTVYDEGRLAAAQQGLRIFDRLLPVLVALAVLTAAGALWVSTRRRRTGLQLAVGAALAAVIVRQVAFVLADDVASLPPTEPGRRAAAAVLDSFVAPLTGFAAWALLGAAAVALVALIGGPYGWAVALRRRAATMARARTAAVADRAPDEPS